MTDTNRHQLSNGETTAEPPMLDLDLLFELSYGMCIVCSQKDGKYSGCTVNTVFQVVPEPPIIAVSVNKQNLTHEYIAQSKTLAVSIASTDTPMELIRLFGFRSTRDTNKFENVEYKIGSLGIPIVLANTTGFLEARVRETIDIETHTLFIAEVVACEILDDEKEPMTYSYYRDIKHGKTPKTAATFHTAKTENKAEQGARNMKKYKCLMCGYIYDPAVGDSENNVEAGTAFEDLPDDWVCPECGVGKDEFESVEE